MSEINPTYNEILFTEEQKNEIIDLYMNKHMSTVKIGKQFGCSHKPILKLLNRCGIETYGQGHRKYDLDINYFDVIDSQNKAYILGFLYADGCNSITKGTISMSLQEEDYEILDLMNKEVKSNRPLEFIDNSKKHTNGYNYKNMYRMNWSSIHMCSSLNILGMMPNKSNQIKYPILAPEYDSHFIRGVFDGDGCIHNLNGKVSHKISITGTYDLNKIIQFKLMEIGCFSHIREASNHNGITSVLECWKVNSVESFLDYIYKDANLYLKRKYNRYMEFKKNFCVA